MGVMRRNPDTKWSASKKKLDRNSRKQFQLLDKAAALVKPGGILVYAVCSYEPEENEGVVHRFLKKHPQYVVDAAAGDNLKPVMDTENGPSSLRCLPHRHCMDGFFGIRLRRMQV
jgi:16S rRNA (cytosine967-C5)-methyltransferase